MWYRIFILATLTLHLMFTKSIAAVRAKDDVGLKTWTLHVIKSAKDYTVAW